MQANLFHLYISAHGILRLYRWHKFTLEYWVIVSQRQLSSEFFMCAIAGGATVSPSVEYIESTNTSISLTLNLILESIAGVRLWYKLFYRPYPYRMPYTERVINNPNRQHNQLSLKLTRLLPSKTYEIIAEPWHGSRPYLYPVGLRSAAVYMKTLENSK